MSTLTILVIIVAGVAVAYLLEEWSEKSTHGHSGVPNRKLSSHLFKPFSGGFYTHYNRSVLRVWGWVVVGTVTGFTWLTVNVPKLFNIAVPYVFFGLGEIAVGMVEVVAPRKFYIGAFPCLSGYNVSASMVVAMGVIMSLIFVPLNYFLTAGLEVQQALTIGPFLMMVLVIAFMVPVIEESFFNSIFGGSLLETWGVLPAIVVVVIGWVAFHYVAFAPLTISDIAFLALFRFVSFLPVVKYKTVAPGLMAHTAVNLSAVLLGGG